MVTFNQLVGRNLRRGRVLRGWDQKQLAEELTKQRPSAPWTAAAVSAAESSWHGSRVRNFDADELALFSLTLGVPVSWFFLPETRDPDAADVTGVAWLSYREASKLLTSRDVVETVCRDADAVDIHKRLVSDEELGTPREDNPLLALVRRTEGQDASMAARLALVSLEHAERAIVAARSTLEGGDESRQGESS